jgi:hypothetical protein
MVWRRGRRTSAPDPPHIDLDHFPTMTCSTNRPATVTRFRFRQYGQIALGVGSVGVCSPGIAARG